MQVELGCGQITWRGVPEEDVLDDIAKAGYARRTVERPRQPGGGADDTGRCTSGTDW